MKYLRVISVVVALAVVWILFKEFFGAYLSLEYLQSRHEDLLGYYHSHTLPVLGAYLLIYILVTALSIPGAVVMTLAGGALFGFVPALIVISFASTIGATLAFLASRYLLRDWVQKRFGDRLGAINRGIEREGAFYLFTLRLVPLFPFFVINLVMGLTPMRVWTYYWVSQVGMFAGTLVYVNAGTQLGQIESLGGILSPGLLVSFALLGVFPLLARRMIDFLHSRKTQQKYPKPKTFDFNLIVVGAGSAGLVAAYIAATLKARVALVEKHKMGGDCLNTGCVPSKALIRTAGILAEARRAGEFGLTPTTIPFDFAAVMERVAQAVSQVEPHDSVERYAGLGVECIHGDARISSPYSVEVNGRSLTTRNIIVATGAGPLLPQLPGLEQVDYLTSDNLWELRALPHRLVILGGGPIGCEMAQAFARFGSRVTLVEMASRLMGREDPDVSDFIRQRLEEEGVLICTDHSARRIQLESAETLLLCDHSGKEVAVPFDRILVAVGRRPNTRGFGLEELGVRLAESGTIAADPFLRTNFPNIFCAGDVAGPYQLTHAAGHQAWYAAVNALFGDFRKFRVDDRLIPRCTFTDPEVACVGLNEEDARRQNIPYEVTRFELADLDRAIIERQTHGWIKILTRPGRDKILGVTLVGPHAGDLLAEWILAMKHGIGLNRMLSTIHPYPTLAEANKMAAGVWKKAHLPIRLIRLIEKYHQWRRGSAGD